MMLSPMQKIVVEQVGADYFSLSVDDVSVEYTQDQLCAALVMVLQGKHSRPHEVAEVMISDTKRLTRIEVNYWELNAFTSYA